MSVKEIADPERRMSVAGHLRELRRRLLITAAVFFLFLLAGIYAAPFLTEKLLRLGGQYRFQFVTIYPEELLLAYLSVDAAASLCAVLPLAFYEAWAFLSPGLRRGERTLMLTVMLSGTLFAALGVLFSCRVLSPFVLRFLMSVNNGSGIRAAVSVRNYLSFLLTQFAVFALVFELPLVMGLLTWFGLVSGRAMRRARKPVIVILFFLAALITPPDIFSQLLVALPLLLLFELSLLLCRLLEKCRRKGVGKQAKTI